MIRVVVAEDSRAAQDLIVALLEADPEIRVVGRAANGAEAVEMVARLRPDLVTLDIQMPVMDGFEATRRIMSSTATPIILVSSRVDRADVELSLRATQLGAVMVLPKPSGPGSPGFGAEGDELRSMVRALSQVKVVRRRPAPESPASAPAARPTPRPRWGATVRVVAVGTSTGGPAALQELLSGMRGFPAAVLVVQHIARGFVDPLVQWLRAVAPLTVRVAAAGERPQPGVVYLAPDDAHLEVSPDGLLLLARTPPVGGFRPSATRLFETVAAAYGAAAVGVVLTGMGSDGVAGLAGAREAGMHVIAQDEATSVVWGMPGAAVEKGLADEVLPLGAIAGRLQALAPG